MSTRHYYSRPAWACLACAEPWPCTDRREWFLGKYASGPDKMRLRGILGTLALDAERDLRLTHEQAHQRFIAWTM